MRGKLHRREGSWSRLQDQPPPPQQSHSALAASRKERPPPERSIQIQDPLGPKHSLSHCSPAKNAWDITDIHSKGDRSCWLSFLGKSLLVAPGWTPALLLWHQCPPGRVGGQEGFEAPRLSSHGQLQRSKTGKSQQETSLSTDQDHIYVGYGLGGTTLQGNGWAQGWGEGFPHLGRAGPSQCWRVTGPSASQFSARDLAAPSAGSMSRAAEQGRC